MPPRWDDGRGIQLVVTDAVRGMPGAIERAQALCAEIPDSFMPQQFQNPANPAVHSVATETSKVSHVIDNMGAGYGRLPDEATRKRMREFILAL